MRLADKYWATLPLSCSCGSLDGQRVHSVLDNGRAHQALNALGQFCTVRAYAADELMSMAPIDNSRLVIAGIIGFLVFAEVPDRYSLVAAAIIVGSTLYIAYHEAQLSRFQRAALVSRPIARQPDTVRDAAGQSTEPVRLRR